MVTKKKGVNKASGVAFAIEIMTTQIIRKNSATHLEGDTIVGRQATNVEASLNQWLGQLPRHLFKSIIFDNRKEFSNCKNISNKQDIDIYLADPGTPSQRGLNEHSNGLLRKSGLPKELDFNLVSQERISHVVFEEIAFLGNL